MKRKLLLFLTAVSAVLVLVAVGSSIQAAKDSGSGKSGRLLKIRVYENGSETPNVVVNIPMGVIGAFVKLAAHSGVSEAKIQSEGIQIGGKEGIGVHGVDLETLWQEIEKMEPGQILEVLDHGDRVDIRVE